MTGATHLQLVRRSLASAEASEEGSKNRVGPGVFRCRWTGALAAAALALVVAGTASAQGSASGGDPIIGVWKLNVERSVWSPGPRPPSNLINMRQYAPLDGGWTRFTQTSTNPQGNPTFQIGVYKIDGQRHPVQDVLTLGRTMTTGEPSGLSRSYRAIDARTVESTTYTDGVAGIPLVRTVSPDGMTFIETNRGTNPQGQEIHNVLVWDRVR